MKDDLVVQRKIRRPRRLRAQRRPILHVAQILAWADAWFERTGRWPLGRSGHIPETAGEKWNSVDLALRQGLRGLRGGSSLARLLAKHRGRPLTIKRILVWADAHHRRTGRWPTVKSGPIEDAAGETWLRVDWVLRYGRRGLPRGSSLSRLLARRRGVVERHHRLPPLSVEQILSWADAHYRREGRWPQASSGRIAEAPGETWCKINLALREGRRGQPGGGSLARFLAKHRGVRTYSHWPALSVEQILAWADAHHRRTGNWPTPASGSVHDAAGETWNGINCALRKGGRGLVGGWTLPRLLAEHRGVVNYDRPKPPLTIQQILRWADAHFRRTGAWPRLKSGRIPEAPGESWGKIDLALKEGLRGLPGGRSLATFLWEYRGVRNIRGLHELTIEQILAWADAHFKRTGRWPIQSSGAIPGTGGETWRGIDFALRQGKRGLPGGSSLPRLLAERRGVPNRLAMGPFSIEQILAWADAYFGRTGRWPQRESGYIPGTIDENWRNVDYALRIGLRGLPGGSSVARLLAEKRGKRNRKGLPPYSTDQILAWADAHHARTGHWPNHKSGAIPEAPGETWLAVRVALSQGGRGLPGGSSLPRLLARWRGVRNRMMAPPLSIEEILAWADAHFARTGRWPTRPCGLIPGTRGETWCAVDGALRHGKRGLPGGSSLPRLLREHRGVVKHHRRKRREGGKGGTDKATRGQGEGTDATDTNPTRKTRKRGGGDEVRGRDGRRRNEGTRNPQPATRELTDERRPGRSAQDSPATPVDGSARKHPAYCTDPRMGRRLVPAHG